MNLFASQRRLRPWFLRIEFLILLSFSYEKFSIHDRRHVVPRILLKIVRANRESLDYAKRLTILRFVASLLVRNKDFHACEIEGAKFFNITHEFEEMVHIH